MQFQCPKCKSILDSNEVSDGMVVACPECGASIECHEYLCKVQLRNVENNGAAKENHEGQPGSIHAKVASAIGIEKLKGEPL